MFGEGCLTAAHNGADTGAYHLRPMLRFIKMYVLQQGFRDGYHGIVLCGLGAFSVFTKYAKLWNIERERRLKVEG